MGNKSSKAGKAVTQTKTLAATCHQMKDVEAISFSYTPQTESAKGKATHQNFDDQSELTITILKKDNTQDVIKPNQFLLLHDIMVDTTKRFITFAKGRNPKNYKEAEFLTFDLSETCSEQDIQELLKLKPKSPEFKEQNFEETQKQFNLQPAKPSMQYTPSYAVVGDDDSHVTINETSTNSESSETDPSVRQQRLFSSNATHPGLPPKPTFIDNQSCIIFQEQKTNDAEPRGRPTKPNELNLGQMQTIDEHLELPAAPEIPSNAPTAPLKVDVDTGIKIPKHFNYKADEKMVFHPERPSLRNIFSNKGNHEASDASDEPSSSHSESTPTPPKKQDVEPSKPQLGLAESYAVQPVTRSSFNPDAVSMHQPPQQRTRMVDQPSMAVFDENRGYNPELSDSNTASTVVEAEEIDRRRLVDNSTNVSNDTFTVLMLIPLLLLLVVIFKRFSESCVKYDAGKNDHDQEAEVDHNIV